MPHTLQRCSTDHDSIRRTVTILAALAISVGAAACGSATDNNAGGSDTSGNEEALSKEDYLKEVNAAQAAFVKDAATLNLSDPDSPKQFGNTLGELEQMIDRLRERLAQVAEPEAVSAQQDKLVRELGDYGSAIRQQQDALTSGNPERAQAAAKKVGAASTTFSREFDAAIGRSTRTSGWRPRARRTAAGSRPRLGGLGGGLLGLVVGRRLGDERRG